ncbi:tetratricopeptide repeat protein [Catalinimonas sp. 4WD22]|uniref:tetratricopeptide repeat protein n=1 Tax=Catalinimonas locisalis TaxID=3133978 RepID=UPI0031011EFB
MLRLTLPLLLLLCCGLSLHAQSKVDSLLTLLKAGSPDTIKIDTYLSLHQALVVENPSQSETYLQEAIQLSEKIDDKKWVCRSYLMLCRYSWKKGQLENAKQALGEVENQRQFFREDKVEATFFMESGIVNHLEGRYELAASFYLKAMPIYEALNDTEGVAKCYNNIGNAYWELEKLDYALENYFKAVDLLENQEEKTGSILGNIGLIYRAKNDFEKALSYYQRSLQVNQKYGHKMDAAIDLQNIGVLYKRMGDMDTSLKYLKESNDLSREIDDQIGVLYTDHGIATIYGELGQYTQALAGLEEALQLAKQLNSKEEIKNLYESFTNTYEKMGQYALALEYRKNFEVWKDSIANEKHVIQIKELEVKYETEKKDKQIILLANEKELQQKEAERQAGLKKASMAGLVLLSLLTGLLVYIFRQRLGHQKLLAAKNEEVREANFKREMSELEIKALRAQINPHFLFNCMNSINRMILQGETEAASSYLTKFSKLVRLILENTEATRVSLANELAMLESYIQLEALRFKGKINYKILVDESLEPENTYLPSMVLQPFVENAIWHGLMHKEDPGTITIAIKEEDDRLLCTIEDNGVGREKAQVLREKSVYKQKCMGMKITEDRLRLLSKERLEQLISITDLKDSLNQVLGTRVDIMVPMA